ncbi:unnamed protein product [Trifolium pratense]|nr:unnamed protein product [Trifolium pratense]
MLRETKLSVRVLFEKIFSREFPNNFRRPEIEGVLIKKLNTTLVSLQTLIVYIEVKHIPNLIVGYWLYNLRDAIFEIDNLFDQALQTEFEADEYQTLTPISPLSAKLQNLIERLECLSSRAHGRFGVSDSNGVSHSSRVWHETATSSVLDDDESSIYGRDADIKKLKHLLLSTHCDDGKKTIISIAGMGGVGKTTLAKLLYNDPEVDDNFELKLWVYVSIDFDLSRVLETILESIPPQESSSDESFNAKRNDTSDVDTVYQKLLLATLLQVLSTAKFLLVLDDVWDTKSFDWRHLMEIFRAGKTGSRIIITTRDERVARSLQIFHSVYYLSPLESEDCWSLVARHAFGECNDQQQSNLEEIGRKIAKTCHGLPLAAITVAAFIRFKLSTDYWNSMLESDIWELIDYKVEPVLKLSYHYLSAPLKQCFAYCSIFPKKSILEKNVVVQLWIAEGLVESFTNQENIGDEYFDELVSKSLIHRRYIGGEEANFEMHSLIHDIATMVSSSYCKRLDEHNLHERIHNLSYNRGLYDSFHKFDKLYGVKDLRTFLALPLQEQLPLGLLSNKVVHNLLPTMKQLGVLSLSNYKSITEVPNSIGDLVYLRYLNLSHTNIERLPSETCKLYNLQFLLLSGCKRLTELPEYMGNLVNLRHLDVSHTALREMPVQIAKLENLHTLSDFVVGKHNGGLKIAELGKFPHLHGKLSISQLNNVNDTFEAVHANMEMKERIDELALEWDCGSTFSDSQVQSALLVLEHLRPSTNLKRLTIKGYGGICFPTWLGDSLFRNMVYLRISDCDNCEWLPPLGRLGNLKELIVDGMQSVQTIGAEFYGSDSCSFQPFPFLVTLRFENMKNWEEWNLIGGMTTMFPCLKTLSLIKCAKLRVGNMPEIFSSLTDLELRECPLLVESTPMIGGTATKFSSLSELECRECPLLVQLPSSSDHVFNQPMFPLNSLQKLTIDGFPSLLSFPTNNLPKTLKFLIISKCENLEFFPHEFLHNFTALEELKISYSCNSMITFTLGALPVLKSLFIEGCKNLKSILIADDASKKSLSFLRSIKLWDCNELESFPPGGLATPNLVYIALWKCEKLRSLPEAMNTLTGLQEMEIDNLPDLQSFVIDDLPSSLQELTVGSVGGIMWNTPPTWEHLSCLSVLRINCNDTVNSLMVPLLPASLVTVCICGFNDKSIDRKWFQHLTSLQNLEIVNAPKLKSLPKNGLPSSLLVLSMSRCPLLDASLRRKQGNEWRKIAHIPSIIIDDELIT